jgi:hypothetical protein
MASTKQLTKFDLDTVAISLLATLLIAALSYGPIIYELFWR